MECIKKWHDRQGTLAHKAYAERLPGNEEDAAIATQKKDEEDFQKNPRKYVYQAQTKRAATDTKKRTPRPQTPEEVKRRKLQEERRQLQTVIFPQ
jgi:hypothetical protein